jgi:hypothetical protein
MPDNERFLVPAEYVSTLPPRWGGFGWVIPGPYGNLPVVRAELERGVWVIDAGDMPEEARRDNG